MRLAFILDHPLMSYRVPFFNILQSMSGHDIVIYHPGKLCPIKENNFEQVTTPNIKIFNAFFYRKNINLKFYDVVVCMQNLRMLNLWLLSFNMLRKYKLIQWGIGTSSSKGLGTEKTVPRIMRNYLMKLSDAVVFYSPFSLQFVNKSNQKKCFVAQNTVFNDLSEDLSSHYKDSFLFIGSLNKRKGLREMISIFHQYFKSNPSNIKTLFIIGDGEEHNYINDYIKINNLQDHIIMVGKIDSMKEKITYFKRSIASISLNQAGLSVLESFSFGVPFITKANAISGGEHLNIIDNENGLLIQQTDDLLQKLLYIDKNIEFGVKLGHNAFNYYHENASMDLMVNNFAKAINYAISRKRE